MYCVCVVYGVNCIVLCIEKEERREVEVRERKENKRMKERMKAEKYRKRKSHSDME